MLGSLHIQGFRAFGTLTAAPLARVNVFVGTNNAGKSSILEAVEILVSRGAARTLWAIPVRRGEAVYVAGEALPRLDANVKHLFFGHELVEGTSFRIGGDDATQEVTCTVATARSIELAKLSFPARLGDVGSVGLALDVRCGDDATVLPLVDEGRLAQVYSNGETGPPVRFLGNDQPLARLLSGSGAALWEKVVLTPAEEQVTSALRIIEPSIERLAAAPRSGSAGVEFFVKLKGTDVRVPMASMGDGLKRLLALALTMATSPGGHVLVDDIDTGLHHSVMSKMWQMMVETAASLDIQVFATTHSLDCITSLAKLFERAPHLRESVCVHRIERGSDRTIVFTGEDVVVAARHEMDLR